MPMTTRSNGRILIVGGYGQVGMVIATQLAQCFPDRVVVAGRSAEKARSAAKQIGRGVEARTIDVLSLDDDAVLDGVALVVVCLDQDDTRFVEACLARGIHYVDISAHYGFLSQVERLDDLARKNGATVVLSVGVEPGLTNLLAAHAQTGMKHVDRVDIFLELGLGDHHGKAAIEWTLDNLGTEFEIIEKGHPRVVRSMSESLEFSMPGQGGTRRAYRFNFSDQHVLGRTLGIPTVSSWMCFSSGIVTWLVAKGSRLGLARILRIRWLRRFTVWLMTRVHVGSDRCRAVVRASGQSDTEPKEIVVGVTGRREATMTATVAAETVRQLLVEKISAGVFHSEQVVVLEPVVDALTRELSDIVWELSLDKQSMQMPSSNER